MLGRVFTRSLLAHGEGVLTASQTYLPANLHALTYMTEILSTVTISNNETKQKNSGSILMNACVACET